MLGTRSIVVGVDGTDSGYDALDWAAAEAATRRLPLRIVHAYMAAPSWAALSDMLQPDDDTSAADEAQHVIKQAVTRARSVASDIKVSTRVLRGAGAPAMVSQSDDAELLVVGSRGLGAVRSLLTGSVSIRVATHAACPVVVVRSRHTMTPGPSATRVVVGVDDTPLSERVIDFAIHAAAQRGVGVTAIRAWNPKRSTDSNVTSEDWPPDEATEWRTLHNVFERWQHRMAGTPIELRLVHGRVQDVLTTESAGAALVVIGSRERGAVRAALRGSVSQAVLQHADCPVAVVRS